MSLSEFGARRVQIGRIQPREGATGMPELLSAKEKKGKKHKDKDDELDVHDFDNSPVGSPRRDDGGLHSLKTPTSRKSISAAGLSSERMRLKVRTSVTNPGASPKASPLSKTELDSPITDGRKISKSVIATPASRNRVADVTDSPIIAPKLKSPGEAGDEEEADTDDFKSRFKNQNGAAGGALRGARMDDHDLDDTYNDMVKNNPLHWADPDFAKSHSEEVFNHYTSHQKPGGREAKVIDITGIQKLADDTVERFLERYRAELVKTNPKFTNDDIEKAMLKELPHCPISFGSKIVMDIKVNVTTHLKKELDRDKDGKVGRMEFIVQWKPAVTNLMFIPPTKSKDLCVIL